jgi:hypothetical protein
MGVVGRPTRSGDRASGILGLSRDRVTMGGLSGMDPTSSPGISPDRAPDHRRTRLDAGPVVEVCRLVQRMPRLRFDEGRPTRRQADRLVFRGLESPPDRFD